mgnify:CR=1 FL=1
MKFRRELFNKNSLVLFENKTNNQNEYFGRDEFSNSVIVKTNEDTTTGSGSTTQLIVKKCKDTNI